ncbi:MAG: glycosyltransferase family 4 protein [Candidatus Hydrogenedentes bacterium]|nr:glycosyltransferase family 4 protein [Candidatus Hydrogenedentota bacterium]
MPDSLNILLMDAHLRGGGQVTYVTSLARELARLGHHITIGCRPGSVLVEAAQSVGADCLPAFQLRGGARLGSWYGDLARVRTLLRAHRPDVLHVNGSQDHWTCALANRLAGRPACVLRTRHNTYPVKKGLPNRVLNRRWTDYQIVVCDVVRRDLAQHPAFDARRMCTVHNGVDAARFVPNTEARERVRTELGFAPSDLVLGIAARLVRAKGHEFLFKAVAQIREQHPELRIMVLGQGDLEASLKQLANDLRIGERVKFLGFRNDMADCIQAFDIGVQPSIDCDTSSFSLKEQMAAEIPVIASNYGGLREIVTDGVEGCVVPAGTVTPLASALRRMLSSEELRRKMGVAARRRVLREFSVEVFAERTVRAYEKALQIHRERTAS